ncbi:MAG: TolC family protein, partial [Candidatus Delongbacteria bacterium]|nr:TolC family protein [Candidatus Delongbacteria bacterium]
MIKFKTTILSIMIFALSTLADVYTLDKAIEVALSNNESVKIAEKELERSDYVYSEAFSGALPKVEANVTYLRNIYSSKITNMEHYFASFANGIAGINNTIMGDYPSLPEMSFMEMPEPTVEAMKNNTIKVEFSLIQPIWIGGKVGTALDIAKIYKEMSISAFKLEKDKVTLEIKKNFYQILLLDESRKVMSLVKKDAYANLDKIEKLYQEGLVSEYDIIQARVRVKSIEPKIVSLDNYYDLAKEYLKINMGLDTSELIEIDGSITATFIPDTTNYYDKAINNRVELKLLNNKKDLLRENVKIKYSDHLPSIVGIANYTFQSQNDDFGDTFEQDYGVGAFNVGITANIPIFNGFGTKAKTDQANIEVKKAGLEIAKTKKFINLQLKDAMSKLKLAREEIVLRDQEIA